MKEPLVFKPKITTNDIANGFVTRYFVKLVSNRKVIEVDRSQYDYFKTKPFYQTLEMRWIINGNDEDTTDSQGKTIYGVRHQNTVLTNYYNEQMPGISSVLRNPLEYFNGKQINTSR